MIQLPKIKTKFSMDEYLMFSSVMMVFMQGFVIKGFSGFDLKLYYFFLFFNGFLFLFKHGIRIHKYLVLLFLLIISHALISYSLYNIPFINFIKQLTGISIAAVYFYNIVLIYDINKLFNIYLKLAVVLCFVAIVFYPTGLLDKELERMDGLMTEPSKFIIVNIPALYYFLKKRKVFPAAILLIGFLLAKSSSGYMAILLIFLFMALSKNKLKYFGIAIFSLLVLFFFLRENKLFNERYNSTIENLTVFQTKSFPHGVNISTYALLKNTYISANNFIDHPLGTGLGSYGYQHDKYIRDLKLPNFIHILNLEGLNKEDANSLFLRLMSDFGIFGIIFTLIFIFLGLFAHTKNYDSEKKAICLGVFLYFLIKFIRMGHYFPEEMYFFLFLFFLTLPKIKFSSTNQIGSAKNE